MDSLKATNELLNHKLKSLGLKKLSKTTGVLSIGHTQDNKNQTQVSKELFYTATKRHQIC